jgi:hypothetical protein
LSEEGFDFLLDGHGCGQSWFVASVEGAGGRWQTGGMSPPRVILRKVSEANGLSLDFRCKVLIYLAAFCKVLI